MKKVLVVSDKKKRGLLYRLAERLFMSESVECTGIEAEKIIRLDMPDYVLLNVVKPVNGDDMMRILSHFDGTNRLRVTIFYIGHARKEAVEIKHLVTTNNFRSAAK